MKRVSIILPALNEQTVIHKTLLSLQPYRQQGHEIIVVDGGSRDQTTDYAGRLCDRLIETQPGRARQMNAGAAKGKGDILLFLHADTQLPDNAIHEISSQFEKHKHKVWGRFDVKLTGKHPLLYLVARLMNLRSRLTGIATGDQAIFILSNVFQKLHGFPDVPLMEDIRFSRTLLSQSRPICIKSRLTTSSRRWEQKGIMRTILLMWYLRLAHFLGKSPAELSRIYSR